MLCHKKIRWSHEILLNAFFEKTRCLILPASQLRVIFFKVCCSVYVSARATAFAATAASSRSLHLLPPQACLAPRPMMPRCSSLPAPGEEQSARSRFLKRSASILGLPEDRSCPRLATVAPSHGGIISSGSCVWSALSNSSPVPSMNTLAGQSATAEQTTALSGDEAWLELQREMGSFRADNRMLLRGSRGGGGQGGSGAHPLRASGSAASVLTKSLAEISTVCAEATTDLLAKSLSLGLDSPKSVWKGEKSGEERRLMPYPSASKKLGKVRTAPQWPGGYCAAGYVASGRMQRRLYAFELAFSRRICESPIRLHHWAIGVRTDTSGAESFHLTCSWAGRCGDGNQDSGYALRLAGRRPDHNHNLFGLFQNTQPSPFRSPPATIERRLTSHSVPEDKPTTVFELTQVDGKPERSTGDSTVTPNVPPGRGGKPTEEKSRAEAYRRSTACPTRGEGGGGRGTSSSPENTKPSQSHRRARKGGESTTATATAAGRAWKPNVHRPLEWFPVPGRQVLLVDPNHASVSANVDANPSGIAAGEAEGTAAATGGEAGRPAEACPTIGGSGDNRGADGGSREDREGHHRRRRRGPQGQEADEGEEGKRHMGGSARPEEAEWGHEHAAQEKCDRSNIVLSARSTLSSAAAPLVHLSGLPTTTGANSGVRSTAKARLLSGRCRARPHTSTSRAAAWGRQKADAPPAGGVVAQDFSTATDFTVRHPQSKPRAEVLGGNRRTPEASHRETSCASMKALGGISIGPFVTPENSQIVASPPNERRGEMADGERGGRIGVAKFSPHRQRGAGGAAMTVSHTGRKGGLQIQRLPVRNTATASRVSYTARKEAGVAQGPPRERRHSSLGTSHWQPRRTAISGEKTSVVRPQDGGATSGGMGRARGRGAATMPPTLHSDNSLGGTCSPASANSSVSSYCGWNKTSNSQT